MVLDRQLDDSLSAAQDLSLAVPARRTEPLVSPSGDHADLDETSAAESEPRERTVR